MAREGEDLAPMSDEDLDQLVQDLGSLTDAKQRQAEADAATEERNDAQFGQIVHVPTTAQPVGGPYTPACAKEREWTIYLQPQLPPAGGTLIPAGGQLICAVTFGLGGAKFTKQFVLTSANLRKIHIIARQILTRFQVVTSTPAAGNIDVAAAIVEGIGPYGPDEYAWTFWPDPIVDADHGQAWQGPGVLGQLFCELTAVAASGTPLYLMLFDSASSAEPANGTVPLPGGVSPAMESVGDWVKMDDELVAGALSWTAGLLVALSTTADTFTAPPAGNQMRVDLKGGL